MHAAVVSRQPQSAPSAPPAWLPQKQRTPLAVSGQWRAGQAVQNLLPHGCTEQVILRLTRPNCWNCQNRQRGFRGRNQHEDDDAAGATEPG